VSAKIRRAKQIIKAHQHEKKRAIWNKGNIAPGRRPEEYRLDHYGALMKWSEYGNQNHKYGWQVDHIVPLSAGGNDDLDNLRPVFWLNNQARNQKPPQIFLRFNPTEKKNSQK
jgi:5-methylcytosine-specific restriction endonuclease McrA